MKQQSHYPGYIFNGKGETHAIQSPCPRDNKFQTMNECYTWYPTRLCIVFDYDWNAICMCYCIYDSWYGFK